MGGGGRLGVDIVLGVAGIFIVLAMLGYLLFILLIGPILCERAYACYEMGSAFITKGELTEAEAQFARALRIYERVVGRDHPCAASLRALSA